VTPTEGAHQPSSRRCTLGVRYAGTMSGPVAPAAQPEQVRRAPPRPAGASRASALDDLAPRVVARPCSRRRDVVDGDSASQASSSRRSPAARRCAAGSPAVSGETWSRQRRSALPELRRHAAQDGTPGGMAAWYPQSRKTDAWLTARPRRTVEA